MNRYSRHTVLPEIGEEGQKKLAEGEVIVIGLGGLGTVISDGLVRAGVGTVRIVDRDIVELSNLQRQSLYYEDDIGKAKAEVAADKLHSINSEVEVISKVSEVGTRNIGELIEGVDIVLDATDNMKTRFILNDACVKKGTPWIYTAILATYGMTMDIFPGKSPCLRCIIETMPDPAGMETCATAGVLFSLPRIMGNIASTEAVKYLTGAETREELLTMDIWKNDYEQILIDRREDCGCCVDHDFKYLEGEDDLVTELCGRQAVQITPTSKTEIDITSFAEKYDGKMVGESLVKIKAEGYELTLFRDGRLVVEGTEDPNKALSIYSEYVGR